MTKQSIYWYLRAAEISREVMCSFINFVVMSSTPERDTFFFVFFNLFFFSCNVLLYVLH